jgi:hypothetical protein
MRWLATILSLLFLGFCSTSCTVRQAQTNAQTALTAAAEGVDAADAVVDEALPGAIEQAGDQAIAAGCADLRACMDAAEDILEPWTNAVSAEDVFTSLLGLLTTVGLEPPALLSTVAPHVSTACGLVVGFVRSQRDR